MNGLVILTNLNLVEFVHDLANVGFGRTNKEQFLGHGDYLVHVSAEKPVLLLLHNEGLIVEERSITMILVEVQLLMVF